MCPQVSGTERVHQFAVLVRRRDPLPDGLRRGPRQLREPERREPRVRGRVRRHGGGAVHGHRRGGGGVPAVQGQQVAAGRGHPAARVPEELVRPDDVRGRSGALRQAVPGAKRRRRRRRRQLAGQTVSVFFGRPVPGVQAGQHVLT